jgi:antitoxin component of MazEF toxin-antitoxin module
LKNPIGNTNIFNNSGITTYAEVRDNASYENKTIVFLTPDDDELQMGSIIQLEKDTDDQLQAYYNGSYYEMADDDIVWYFSNSTIAATKAQEEKFKLYYENVYEPDGQKNADFTCEFYFRTDYDDDSYWHAELFETSTEITLYEKVKSYYIENIAQLAQEAGSVEKAMPQFMLGFLLDYELAVNPSRYKSYSFRIPKRLVELVDLNEENALKVKMKRNKSVKPKTKQITTVKKDKAKPKLKEEVPQIVNIEQVPFTKAQKVKSKQIKMQIKYPEDEYDKFSASELFN